MLKPSVSNTDAKVNQALEYYASHTAQIEVTTFDTWNEMRASCSRECYVTCSVLFQIVRHDRTLEQIVFPIPEMCEYLTEETKLKVLHTAERDDQGSKVSDFFERTEDMLHEMQWQKKLRG